MCEKERSTKDLKMRRKEHVEEVEKTGVSFHALIKAMTQAQEVAYTNETLHTFIHEHSCLLSVRLSFIHM